MKLLKIAMVGGGPGGIMLGRLLLLKKIPFTIFELESGPNKRNQGGTGQVEIENIELFKVFQLKARPEGDL